MDIQRTVLWVVFSVSMLFLWDSWMRHNGQQSLFFPAPASQQAAPAAGATPRAGDVPQASASPATAAAVPGSAALPQGEVVTITTDVIKAEIDTLGGELRRLELLKQRDAADPSKNVVLFDVRPGYTYVGQSGLIGGAGNLPNHKSLFQALPGARVLDNGDQLQLVLVAEQDGVKLTKTYTFRRNDYTIGLKHEVANNSGAAITPSVYMQLVRDGNKPAGESKFYSTFTGPAVYTEAQKFQKLKFEDIADKSAKYENKADNGWFAIVQHYFVAAFIPPQGVTREIFTKTLDTNLYAIGSILPVGNIAPGANAAVESRLYAGPQESSRLEKVAPGLELVKDYGWLTIIAKPIFWLMNQLHKVIGNWGWTIIALTVIIKLAFFPLSAASYRSMAKMKTVTPKLTAIRERYKSDPQKMNQAMMELYRSEKINPLGGCLPIVVQIPVFIALYWVLLASVEMRGAPWLGWIHDLTAPDPFYILPIVMAISMFIQTKLNPTPPDPIQAKVMLVMPIVFSVFFFFFPAGLVLYWVVNNILSITQQWVITRRMADGASA